MNTEQESAIAVAAQATEASAQPETAPQPATTSMPDASSMSGTSQLGAAHQPEAAPAQSELAAVTALLEQLRLDSARQCQYAKKQLFCARLSAGVCGVLLVAMLCVCAVLAPRVHAILQGADALIAQTQVLTENLEIVSTQIAQSDIPSMLQNVDALVTQSQDGITKALLDVEEALKVIQSFDIAALNGSVRDLHSIISPLAKLLGG